MEPLDAPVLQHHRPFSVPDEQRTGRDVGMVELRCGVNYGSAVVYFRGSLSSRRRQPISPVVVSPMLVCFPLCRRGRGRGRRRLRTSPPPRALKNHTPPPFVPPLPPPPGKLFDARCWRGQPLSCPQPLQCPLIRHSSMPFTPLWCPKASMPSNALLDVLSRCQGG